MSFAQISCAMWYVLILSRLFLKFCADMVSVN